MVETQTQPYSLTFNSQNNRGVIQGRGEFPQQMIPEIHFLWAYPLNLIQTKIQLGVSYSFKYLGYLPYPWDDNISTFWYYL